MDPGHEARMTRSEQTVSETQPQDLDALIDAGTATLGLPIESEWKPGIRANLQVTLRLAQMVAEFELPDEAEPAPVFEA
jgi:RNAse (barnase) inhibitor barstar